MEPPTSTERYDCIIVGSGAGGAAAAYTLVNAGLRVLLIEKGDELPKDVCTQDIDSVMHENLFRSREAWRDRRGHTLVPEEYFNVGGKTKWYGAALQRFSHEEFDANVPHQCVPWPFPYGTLGPYYSAAEKHLGAREFECEPQLQKIVGRLEKQSPHWTREPLPMGLSAEILSNRLEASRIDGFASLRDLKGDAGTAFIVPIRKLENFTLLTRVTVTELIGDPNNAAQIVGVGLEDGQRLYARSVLLAAGALHSPRLLQRYLEVNGLSKTLPSYKNVGRNLKLQLRSVAIVFSLSRKTDLLRATQMLVYRDYRRSSIQPLGYGSEMLASMLPEFLPQSLARALAARAYGFLVRTEDGSHSDNRVYEDPDAKQGRSTRVIDYDPRRVSLAMREHRGIVKKFGGALRGVRTVVISKRLHTSTACATGTLMAGSNPETSVVNAAGAVHGMKSLFVVDGSALPRSSRVGPALTIYAWALRVADQVALSLRN